MRDEARRLNLRGWVRNRSDGAVEAVVIGPSDAVAEMIQWCRRGPSGAMVTDVTVEDGFGSDVPAGFEIRY